MLSLELTRRCNLRCFYCYADAGPWAGGEYQPLSVLLAFHDEFLRTFAPRTENVDVAVTGGEPLLRSKDALEFLRAASEHPLRRDGDLIALNTNGTLIDGPLAMEIGALSGVEVWISLDGDQAAHDYIRGPGTFRRSLRALEAVAQAGGRVGAAFVPTSDNIDSMLRCADTALEAGAHRFVVQFPIYAGRGRSCCDSTLIERLNVALGELHARWPHRVASPLERMTRYRVSRDPCPVGKAVAFHVAASGDIFPCYALCGSGHSIGSVEDWPHSHEELRSRLGAFHMAREKLEQESVASELVACPGAIGADGLLPEGWRSVHDALLGLDGPQPAEVYP